MYVCIYVCIYRERETCTFIYSLLTDREGKGGEREEGRHAQEREGQHRRAVGRGAQGVEKGEGSWGGGEVLIYI